MLLKIYLMLIIALSFTLPSVSYAAKKAQGVFTVVKGKVKVQRKGKKKQRKVKVGTKVYASDIILSGKDSRAKIVMKDNNILNISPESKLEIEKYEFEEGSKERKVMLKLMYGKVRSTVKQKYDGDKNVYRVKTPSAVAGVRGTDFLVDFNSQTKRSQIVTFEGQVQVASGLTAAGRLSNPVSVNPGQFTFSQPGEGPRAAAELPKNQLVNIERDSSAELPSGQPPEADNRSPANSGEKKPQEPTNRKEGPRRGGQLPSDNGLIATDESAGADGNFDKRDGVAGEYNNNEDYNQNQDDGYVNFDGRGEATEAGAPQFGEGEFKDATFDPNREPSSFNPDGEFNFMPPQDDLIGANPDDYAIDVGPEMGDFDRKLPINGDYSDYTRNPAELDPNVIDQINRTDLTIIINE